MMIARTRVLQFKQFESDPRSTTLRLTDCNPKGGPNDTYVVIQADGENATLEKLLTARGKRYRVTIEEIG